MYVLCVLNIYYDDACGKQIGNNKKSKSISMGKLTNFVELRRIFSSLIKLLQKKKLVYIYLKKIVS